MFRDKFWVSLALTVPTLVWGHMLPRVLGYTPPLIPGYRWIAPVLGTVVFLYGGLVFLQGAWRELRARLPGMMTLIGLAISVAFVFSAAVTLGYPGMRPGGSVPADGTVADGASEVNESMITGESRPVKKAQGARVIAGTVNGAGSLRVTVTGTGEQTALAGIMRLVEQAQTSRSRAQALADRAAFWLTIAAILAGALTFVVWMAVRGNAAFAVERLVTVLVISCPHALGLAVPLVVAISTTLGAKGGLLVRDRRGLEEARNLTAVVFDKTGTLTRGEFGVVSIATAAGITEQEVLRLAGAVERDSEHTIARGIVRSAKEQGIVPPSATSFRAIPGVGVSAHVDGRSLLMGGPALLKARSVAVPDAPALVSADVGVAIGAGTDVAVEAGDIVLVRSDPRDVPRIVRLSRASYRKMVQNLWWAADYNVVAIPLAAGVLASRGVLLSPAVGAVLMSLSTVIVAINAQLLRRSRI
jgi:Cu2+-exporting ATPase